MQRKIYCSTFETGIAKNGNEFLKVNASFKENGVSKQTQYYVWDNVGMFKQMLESGMHIFNVEVTDDPSFPKIQSFVTCAGDLSEFFDFIYESDAAALEEYKKLLAKFTTGDVFYLDLIKAVLSGIAPSGKTIANDFILMPGAKGYHHNYRYGLLQHTIEVMDFVDAISQQDRFKNVINRELALCGAMLHDVGKVFEYRFDGVNAVDYDNSAYGQIYLGSHLYKGAELVAVAYEKMKAGQIEHQFILSEKTDVAVEHIKHIILSHHLLRDWGAVPKQPQTPEAYLVFLADYFSAAFGKFNSLDWSQVSMQNIMQATSKSDTFFGFTPLMADNLGGME